MIISERHQFIFIKTRKTAGTSLQHALSAVCGANDVITPTGIVSEDYRPRNYQGLFNPMPYLFGKYDMHRKKHCFRRLFRRQRIHDHMFLRELFDLAESGKWKNYFRFCVERNPWDKVVSSYFWKFRESRNAPDFETYVARARLVSDFEMYSLNGAIASDAILKYEELPDTLAVVEQRIGVKIPQLARANSWTRRNRDYRSMYSEVSREIVAKRFAREIAAFGYSFD